MIRLRTWLNQNPLAWPYRWLRDWIYISANRRALIEQSGQLQVRLDQAEKAQASTAAELTRLIDEIKQARQAQSDELNRRNVVEQAQAAVVNEHADQLARLAPLHMPGALPFAFNQPAPPWIANAERVLGRRLSDLPSTERDRWFYSFYSEMAGGLGHILQQQYQVYLPLMPKLEGKRALDIGCGAGEFLDFLHQQNIAALGIDLDAEEVVRAQSRGLDAIQADAVEFLQSCDEQFSAISLFQVIEHVPPAQVRPLLAACIAALAPGGVLLVETINLRHPNALNGFYTDPTHQVPLSDNYLSMLAQWYGLERVELLYTLPEWLPGISHDDRPRCYANYTVVGYRSV